MNIINQQVQKEKRSGKNYQNVANNNSKSITKVTKIYPVIIEKNGT